MNKFSVKSFSTNELFACSSYVINSDEGTILIDSGYYSPELSKYLNQIGNLDAILLTHGHGDHIRDVDIVVKDFSDVQIYIHREDVELLTNPNLNCSLRVGDFNIVVKSKAIGIDEGILKIGGYNINVIHVPGHTNGGVMFYFEDYNIIFLGDTILGEYIGTMNVPTGNEGLMYQSLEKFKNLGLSDDTMTYSGHGDMVKYADLLKINHFL